MKHCLYGKGTQGVFFCDTAVNRTPLLYWKMVSETYCRDEYFSASDEYSEFIDSRSFVGTTVLRSILSLLAIICNILIIVAIKRTPSLHTPSYLLVVSQSVSDLCVGLFVQPLHTAWQVAHFKRYIHIRCIIFSIYYFVCPFFTTVSCFTMTAISYDRFLAIYTHSRYHTIVTRKRTIAGIILICVLAGVGCYSTIANEEPNTLLIWNLVSGVSCMFVSSLSFFASGRLLHQRHLQTSAINVSGERRFNFGKYKRSLVTMVYVYVLFLVCYLPLFVHYVLNVFNVRRNISVFEFMVIEVFYINSTINTFVYFWRNRSLRMTVKTLVGLTNNRHETEV